LASRASQLPTGRNLEKNLILIKQLSRNCHLFSLLLINILIVIYQARKYFGHLATLRHEDADVWLCLSVCCAMAEEFEECSTALKRATNLIEKHEEDVRVKFCHGKLYHNFYIIF